MRVGIGYDVHRLEEGRRLVLGGVEIGHPLGLAGHSDADVVAHALVDALLGAVGLGDIGTHFPDTDERWKGASSLEFLRATAELLKQQGWRVVNADVTVVAEAPRLGPYVPKMRERLAGALDASPGSVSVKAKTPEGLGALGRGAGIAALAVACVEAGPEGVSGRAGEAGR